MATSLDRFSAFLVNKYGAIRTAIEPILIWKINRTKSRFGKDGRKHFFRCINVRKASGGSRPYLCFMSDWAQTEYTSRGDASFGFLSFWRMVVSFPYHVCLYSMNHSSAIFRYKSKKKSRLFLQPKGPAVAPKINIQKIENIQK